MRPIAKFTGRPCDIQPRGELGRIFASNTGRIVHKWLHYLPIYERHLANRRGTEFRMLEIGVYKGGSLQTWREYFGPRAIICGVDIDPDCAAYADSPNRVMIGLQDDAAFLNVVVGSMGGVDVVLDDGRTSAAIRSRASTPCGRAYPRAGSTSSRTPTPPIGPAIARAAIAGRAPRWSSSRR